MKCCECDIGIMEAADKGLSLVRVNPKGETPFIGRCDPNCTHEGSGQEEALLNALDNVPINALTDSMGQEA